MSVLAALWSLRERRPGFVALSLLGLAAFLSYPLVDVWLRSHGLYESGFGFYDWGAFSAGVSHWQAGEPIYIRNADGGYHGSYLYPPFVLLVFWPFVEFFQFDTGAMVWGAFSVGLLWIGIQAVVAALETDVSLHPAERLLLLGAIVGFHPVLISLKLGQMAAFQVGLLCLACAAMLRQRNRDRPSETTGRVAALASGALTAFVGLAKLPYATAGAHLLADRRRFAGAVAGGVVVLGVSLLVFGPEYHRAYRGVLAWGMERGDTTRPPLYLLPPYYRPIQWLALPSLTLGGLTVPLDRIPLVSVVRYAGVGAIAAVSLTAVDADRETFALGAAGVPLLAPITYAYYLAAAIPAAILLLAIECRREDGWPVVPVLGLILVGFHTPLLALIAVELPKYVAALEALRPLFLAQPGLWGNLLLVGLAFRRVAEKRVPVRTRLRELSVAVG